MKKKQLLISVLALATLVGCDNGDSGYPSYYDGDFHGYADLNETDYPRKKSYTSYISTIPATLNSTTTNQENDSSHIVNFIDGLVENDRFGNIVPALATGAPEINEAKDEYTYHIKEGVKWVQYNGEQYKDKTVKPSDFLTAAQYALNFQNSAEGYYLLALIIEGANEYYQATRLNYELKSLPDNIRYTRIGDSMYRQGYADHVLSEDEVSEILQFKKIGIYADDVAMTLKYKLKQRADYFPTMLTYTAYLPVQADFVEEVGFNNYGIDNTHILYCGAYLLSEQDTAGTRMVYKKNPEYWDLDSVKVDTITFYTLPTEISKTFARDKYNAGEIDSFALSEEDKAGWEEYVTGKNGTGTIEEPANPLAFSNFGEGSKSPFIFYLNQSRDTDYRGVYNSSLSKYVKNTSVEAAIENTNKALKYSYFRQAVLDSLDLDVYYYRFSIKNEQIRSQYAINTYTPTNFVFDDNGKDYFEYLVDAYVKKNNVTKEEATTKLEQMNPTASKLSLEESQRRIKEACEQLKKDDPSITFPVYLEYAGIYYDTEQRSNDEFFVEACNEAFNGIIFDENMQVNAELSKVYGYDASDDDVLVRVINNSNIGDATVYTNISDFHAFSLFVSGWIPDFEDPLTFLNTATLNGDMAKHFGTAYTRDVAEENLSAETLAKFDHYDELVKRADAEFEDKSKRYSLFAEAEIYLLQEMGILRPVYMTGLGYQVSVSNIIPYRSPRAGYGSSNDKYKGMELLYSPLTARQRAVLKAEWEYERAESRK